MVNKKPRDLNLWVFLLAIEIIRSNKGSVIPIPLKLDFHRVGKFEELESSLLVEILEFTIAPVMPKIPGSEKMFVHHSYVVLFVI
jgi:hypothetical protein